MKKRLIFLVLLLTVVSSWSQAKVYEFQTFDKRTPDGWNIINMSGEVQIDEQNKEIIIITEKFMLVYDVISKQQFIRLDSFLYGAYDWRGEIIRIKIDKCDEESNTLDFYYYSDEKDMKYFRLCLTKCAYEN